MNRYEPGTPRFALSLAAVALTALMIGLTVVLPTVDLARHESVVLAAAQAVAPGSANRLARLSCVDVEEVAVPRARTPEATTGRGAQVL